MGESEGPQQYCLRWNNHSESIVSEFEILLGQEDFVDVTLSCDRHSLKAHKVVLSACSAYFRRILKENPCQHPIIILRDVGHTELAAVLHFMYHGQVMVEQERIPQLLQTAQMLEVRGLCEIQEGESSDTSKEDKDEEMPTKGSSFLSGLLVSNISATKRTIAAANSCSNSNQSSKRHKPSPRPIPKLQSILSQQMTVSNSPVFEATNKNLPGNSARALTALASQAQSNSMSTSSILPTSLENLLGGLSSVAPSTSAGNGVDNLGSRSSTASSEEMLDREGKMGSSCSDVGNSSLHGGVIEMEPYTVVQIKEEPLLDFEDEFCDDSTRGGATGDEEGQSESEAEQGTSENSRGEASLLPLLAQHLATPNMLSASAKLRAAASQARTYSTTSSPLDNSLIAQVLLTQPSTPPDMGPASMGMCSDTASSSGEPPRKLAFHEPRPCPICRRMYRDAATLRTHTAIMHAEGRDKFACLCGELFRTKYEMYNHKKNGHM